MRTDRSSRIDYDLFLQAAEITDPDERHRFVQQACSGDPSLLARIEELLAVDAKDRTGVIDEAAAKLNPASRHTSGLTPLETSIDVASHPSIGPYRVLEEIARGGMGVIYLAEQSQPIHRKVALKIIRPGMDSQHVVARFEAERQALAMMNHPNIAKVLDAGATEGGLPYFVMELVKGIPITKFCDQQKLDLPRRLNLFVAVCQAVQHAHQKGVIHRDLKPSNVLVELHDIEPVPKVIDFGVAKAIDQSLTNSTLQTGFHQLVGTPMYMSPEQAQLSSLDVDTRSDVYSLGVLLYELVVGETPLDPDKLRFVDFDEMRRIIREDDPLRPSQRVSTMAIADQSTLAANRRDEPRRLERVLRGELDWIIMKSLEKDRTRRYQSANEFAQDVDRFVQGAPVLAHPPSRWYTARKFASRHRGLLSVSAVLVVLVATSCALLWNERQRTLTSLENEARLRAEAVDQRETAEANLDLALEAVDSMYVRLATRWMDQRTLPSPMQEAFINRARQIYDQMLRMPRATRSQKIRAAMIYERIALLQRLLLQDNSALENLGHSIEIAEALPFDSTDETQRTIELLRRYRHRADLLSDMARYNEAFSDYRDGIAHVERLAEESSLSDIQRNELAHLYIGHARVLVQQGQSDVAETSLHLAEGWLEEIERVDLEFNITRLELGFAKAETLWSRGNWQRSYDEINETLRSCRGLRQGTDDERRSTLLESRISAFLGALERESGNLPAAEANFREAMELCQQSFGRPISPARACLPSNALQQGTFEPRLHNDYVDIQLSLVDVLMEQDRLLEAESQLGQTVMVSSFSRMGSPQDLRTWSLEANSWGTAWLLLKEHRPLEAISCLQFAELLVAHIESQFPQVDQVRPGVHGQVRDLAWLRKELNANREKLLAAPDLPAQVRRDLDTPSVSIFPLAQAHAWLEEGNMREAVRFLEQASNLREDQPVEIWFYLAQCEAEQGHQTEAKNWFEKAKAATHEFEKLSSELDELRRTVEASLEKNATESRRGQ